MKIGFISLGCPKNLVDSEVMMGLLEQRGHELTSEAKDAEALVVNTCSFIETAKQESIDTILEACEYKRTGNARRLVVAGCLVERYRREPQAEIPEIDAVLGTGEIESIIDHCEGTGAVAPAGSGHDYLYHDLTPRRRATPRHFAYVKINEGCDHPCSFCIIPQLRGGFRSRHFESIISEARRLFGEGVRELTLIGQDTTAYGEDLGVRNGLPGAHELLGYDLLEVGRAEDAIPHLQTALQEQPANEQVEAWLGRAYLSAGRPRDAVPHLESAASAAPSNTQLLYLLAKAYAQLAARTQAQLLAAAPDSVYAPRCRRGSRGKRPRRGGSGRVPQGIGSRSGLARGVASGGRSRAGQRRDAGSGGGVRAGART